ncbi:phosphoribosyltransferase [Robertkochia marina]|uniref:Phosphoribosyltransferase n=1 Tax=Robertkochia marina TaxID=1227945 RepID=A0A4S3LYC6_9FLAO|nr:phosphoribosyltransferase family protein [Robertkochia marina]THD66600.1 phosphoribosyltransferase [Robertkochia marina]TRZ45561.1 phosphoribosyltransferase [Robertkochia marina]
MFLDRSHAGKLLAEELKLLQGPDTIVVAIPRGGLPVGAEIATALKAPLEIILSKKIGHPANKEYAIGAVSLSGLVLELQAAEIPKSYIEEETKRIRKVLQDRQEMYYHNQTPKPLTNKTVIVADDGIATGNTMLSTLELISRESPKKVVLAIPVAPESAIKKLKKSPYIHQIVCLKIPGLFNAVGAYYHHFDQVSDRQAIEILEAHRNR